MSLSQEMANAAIILLLLTILGFVSFSFKAYVSGGNGISFGTKFGTSIMRNTAEDKTVETYANFRPYAL